MIKLVSTLLAVLLLSCCAKPAAHEMEGLYRSSNEATKAYAGDYFAITPNRGLYGLDGGSATEKYHRQKYADVAQLQYSFEGNQFSSGRFEGTKVKPSDASVPVQLQNLGRSIAASSRLKVNLKQAGFDLDFRMAETYPRFSAEQAETLEALANEPNSVIDLFKSKGLTTLFVHDGFYGLGDMLTTSPSTKRLYLPPTGKLKGKAVVEALKAGNVAAIIHIKVAPGSNVSEDPEPK